MKALTLAPDWGMLVMQGEKTIECRTWSTPYRGDLLICTSAKRLRGCISGHAIVQATLSDIVPFTKAHLDGAAMDFMPDGKCFAWLLNDIHLIKPFPVKGRLGLFDVEHPVEVIPDDLSGEESNAVVQEFILPLIFRPVQA